MALCPNIQRVYVHIAWRRENHKGKILESINMDKIDLNALRDRAYKTDCEHGFHDEELSNEHCLMLVITELSESVKADRKGKRFVFSEIL